MGEGHCPVWVGASDGKNKEEKETRLGMSRFMLDEGRSGPLPSSINCLGGVGSGTCRMCLASNS